MCIRNVFEIKICKFQHNVKFKYIIIWDSHLSKFRLTVFASPCHRGLFFCSFPLRLHIAQFSWIEFNRISIWKKHQMTISQWVPPAKTSPLINHSHQKVNHLSQSQRPSSACHCTLPFAQRFYFYLVPSYFYFLVIRSWSVCNQYLFVKSDHLQCFFRLLMFDLCNLIDRDTPYFARFFLFIKTLQKQLSRFVDLCFA